MPRSVPDLTTSDDANVAVLGMSLMGARHWHRRTVWLLCLGLLLGVTATLHAVRGNLNQAHVVLIYLLLVLAGSVIGGRAPGLALAVLSFLSIDYFFQTPYDRLGVGNALDWFVLVTFLLTAMIAAGLLVQAQTAAERAARRTNDVLYLSRLGAELLGSGTAENALEAIAEEVRDTMGGERCKVLRVRETRSGIDLDQLVRLGEAESGESDMELARTSLVSAARVGRRLSDDALGPISAPVSVPMTDGTPSDFSTIALPLRVHGRAVGILVVAADRALSINEASIRLLDALSYYAALAVERVALVSQLEHAEAARESARVREALLASVSHDLRTPLSTIKLLAQDSVARRDVDRAIENADIISEQADRLSSIVNNLLDLTRLRSAAFPIRLEINAVDDIVGAVARQVHGILGNHELQRTVDDDGGVLLGRFDFVQTQRILVNLIENSVRYAPERTTISLHVWREDEWLLFRLSDQGPGISMTERDRIFEPFYRSPTASVDAGGVGLGLYISRALAEAQGGRLDLLDALDGATFVLALRAVTDAADPAESEVDCGTSLV